MEQERILVIATSDILYDQRLQKIAGALHDFGATVTLLGRKPRQANSFEEKPFKQKRISCFFNKGILFYAEINLRFFFFILFSNYTKVCANDADTLFAAWMALFFKRFELYYDAHELFTEVPELANKNLKRKVWTWVQKVGVKKVKKAYTVNQSLAAILQQRYGIHFDVVQNVPQYVPEKNTTSNKSYILYQGALNKGRGLEQLIAVMPLVNIKLHIAGDGDISDQLKQQVKDLKLEEKVIFLGKISPKDLVKHTKNAFIGVNLLEDTSKNYYYSLANKFFDYAHAGIPQICMNFPEYKTINSAQEVAILVDDLSQVKLQEAIERLMSDASFYEKLKDNCEVLKEAYNWQQEKQKLKQIYAL